MATAVIMPRQGNTVESCIITEWHKNEGDAVKAGDILFSYETDKASFDEEAKQDGILLKILCQKGDDVPCLANVCVIGEKGEDVSAFVQEAPAADTEQAGAAEESGAPAQGEAAPAEAAAPAAKTAAYTGGPISPRARALAEKSGADLSFAQPTGPDGRLIERDVRRLMEEGHIITPAAAGSEAGGKEGTGLGGRFTTADIGGAARPEAAAPASPAAPAAKAPEDDSYTEPLSNMRKVIARTMTQSLSSMAQLTHTISFDATEIQKLRRLFKEKGEAYGMDRVSLNDIIMFAVARTLAKEQYRSLNANLIADGTQMKYYRHVNLGMACDTERGLVVPTIRAADTLSLKELSDTAKYYAQECKAGRVMPDWLKDASFTVSNLGSMGIESFTPVINPPQTGILGVCSIVQGVRASKDGGVECYPSIRLCLTYDHRALDGTPASRFLKDLKDALENITMLLARG